MPHEHMTEAQDIVLKPGESYRCDAPRGTRISVYQGTLWLTVSSCREDHFLSPSQSYRLKRKGLLLIEPAGTESISFSVCRLDHFLLSRLWRAAMGVWPVQRLKARWKAPDSEKPSKYATSPNAKR